MSFLDTFIGRFAPHDCLGCGAEGGIVCRECERAFFPAVSRCYRCQKPSDDFLTCQRCLVVSPLQRVVSVAQYSGLAKQLVQSLKFGGVQAAAHSIATHMGAAVIQTRSVCVVPVPTATSRARQRGYDQAKILARQLSKQSGLPYLDCLVRRGQSHQVGASRQQRLEQITGAFRVRRTGLVDGAELLLVDDVITTGASLEAAAQVLAVHGAGRITAVVFAQA